MVGSSILPSATIWMLDALAQRLRFAIQGRVQDELHRAISRGLRFFAAFFLAASVLPSCETPVAQKDASLWEPAGSVKRHEAIAIADCYVQHRWRPTDANIFHGTDEKGVRVDTPDACYCPGGGVAASAGTHLLAARSMPG